MTQKILNQMFHEFVQRVMLVRKYVLKAPGRFIPNPRIWLDPAFKKGFSGTEDWLKQVKNMVFNLLYANIAYRDMRYWN